MTKHRHQLHQIFNFPLNQIHVKLQVQAIHLCPINHIMEIQSQRWICNQSSKHHPKWIDLLRTKHRIHFVGEPGRTPMSMCSTTLYPTSDCAKNCSKKRRVILAISGLYVDDLLSRIMDRWNSYSVSVWIIVLGLSA